ncbi:outer membrane beta-barrel family protein [Pedobacter sp. Leaf194]|uniref:outer membrane beta-barrel family protein n=1 Tax=Pedobacter sp. Leaf194 TaxID=1736297 RepID=UPI0007027CB6|nr:outer membrane beta-barrel family protein [Pedobacter sp. Leaf194]KQS41935.1 TonB-dependent receptor [Pedobacter sp. Leaf194]
MITRLLSLCLLMLISSYLKAQTPHTIKGKTIDTASTTLLYKSSISVLNAKDSTLVKFTRSAENGTFTIGGLKNGKFILLVTYPKYADFVEAFTLDSTREVKDFKNINLTGMAKILADVIIKGNRNAIKIKGDTTEFDPKAYNIEANAKVEDLIKQFPGFQVDKDGKITAQGKSVPKVLVDGEEFFGDDPTLVTKNLRADMVESVQLYDKASDQASFTGVDDGEKTKTLNIKLKEDKKNGYFGKLQGGIATDKFYTGQGMFNKFWGKKKFSAYGIFGNTGTVGLGWDDRDKYGGTNMQDSDQGYTFSSVGNDDFDNYDGQYNGEGIPVARTGGIHFDSKWNKDKESLNTNYKIGSIRVTGEKNTINQNNLSNGVINTIANQYNSNDMFRQKLDFTYEVKLDTTFTLKVSVDGTLKESNTDNKFNTVTRDGNNDLLNSTDRTLQNNVDEQVFNMSALLSKRFKKKGRTLSLSLIESLNKTNSDGFLNSDNKFYSAAGTRDSLINQNKVNNITNSAFRSNLVYTEPLSKALTLVVNYGLNVMNGKSDRKSFNQSASGNYDILDTQFSNDYELDQLINQGGAIFNYKKGKSVINFGSKLSGVNFKQADLYNNVTYNRNFINYMPQASFQYRFSQQKSFRLSYNGNTNQPTLEQIQPIRVNTDPLNIVLGNPDLKPSFRSNFAASYNSYKIISDQSIWLNGSYGFVNNPIVSDVITDATTGKSTIRSVNIADKTPTNFYLYANMSKKLKLAALNIGLSVGANGSSSYNYINNELNNTKNYSYQTGVSLSKYEDKKYNFYLRFGPTYNISRASVGNFGISDGWGTNGYFYGNVKLPAKLEIGTDVQYEFRGKTQRFNETFERVLWNASIIKKFFKAENLKLLLSVNDILNQNVGFDRSASNSNISQTSYTTIKRYFMFSVIWDFTKMGGTAKTQK